ncbi:hypothetical protein [Streptomyces lavendulae]|uniref:hypothetical protein n=1 Tax=Streptomyces lavendulae TaxID=1914 RepID=UPI00340119EF
MTDYPPGPIGAAHRAADEREAAAKQPEPICKFTQGCHRVVSCDPGCGAARSAAEHPGRHTADTITSDALDALYEMLDAAQETELARQLATADKAFMSAHLRAARLGSALARAQRAHASTILQARRQAARADQAEAALARVRALHFNQYNACLECAGPGGYGDSPDWPCNTIRALDEPQEPTP